MHFQPNDHSERVAFYMWDVLKVLKYITCHRQICRAPKPYCKVHKPWKCYSLSCSKLIYSRSSSGNEYTLNNTYNVPGRLSVIIQPEDHWSCIAHLSTEDMLKSAVVEKKKFKKIESE